MTKSKYYYIRNAARVLGLVACVFYLFISFKGGLVKVMRGTEENLVPFFPFLAIAVAGYMISYVQEKKGGYIMLVGGAGLFIFFLIYSGGVDFARASSYGLPFILAALGLVYCSDRE
ncbi:MAG TPA: hypothetical protein VHO90_11070 [Bacteroidales bacterium]|nr:hypothetical protein [Bacteroidales bacterium]